jgi:hypothetical protein
MKLATLFAPLLIASATIAIAPATGCYAEEGAYVVDGEPPAPREEVVVARPGSIWIHGHYGRDGGRWAWRGGYYERERPNHNYVEGRWERRGRGRVWVNGGWHARVVVR